jgi:hypothetical protein
LTNSGAKLNAVLRNLAAFLFLLLFCVSPNSLTGQTVVEQEPAAQADQKDNGAKDDSKEAAKKGKKKRSVHDRFMRVRKDAKGRPVALQTSIVRYQLKTEEGKTINVDLIGAVHIGEKKYYEDLNEQFDKYEGLLYELVAPEGTVIPKGGREEDDVEVVMNPIAAMQQGMKKMLGLEFQLEHIDYTKKNFIHADMTPEEFGKSMADNDDSVGGYALRAFGQSMAMQAAGKGDSSVGMMMALFSKNKTLRMRRMMADQMKDMESGMIMFEGKDGSTIIDHRNAKCMKVLEREIAAGKTSIGIFYGAGHLADMERRLESDFKMTRGGARWLNAWKLTNREQK